MEKEKTITQKEFLDLLKQDGWGKMRTPYYYLGIPLLNHDHNIEKLDENGFTDWDDSYEHRDLPQLHDPDFLTKHNLIRSDYFHHKGEIVIWLITDNHGDNHPPFVLTNQISKWGTESQIFGFNTYEEFLDKLEECVIESKIFHLQNQLD
jgi:hypothetical protein